MYSETIHYKKKVLIKICYISELPFASKFSLAFFIEEESRVTVSPSVPFHDVLPVANKMSRRLNQCICLKTQSIFSALNRIRTSVKESSSGCHLE